MEPYSCSELRSLPVSRCPFTPCLEGEVRLQRSFRVREYTSSFLARGLKESATYMSEPSRWQRSSRRQEALGWGVGCS